ncbi:RidA family protein [Saccharibacter sp. 17.LH.SD]|uniref:RidA family protein n=1 Tax=Saccharibacter sp. 17.LH.SD TaxID=2689393 RepID=UPI001367A2B4|nr:RidA family protein [Saccharibacter sp. 17.LH.SD]MXV45221.1 RidA family protein [Saccharibacter sp. 17.LH.SD]
MTATIDARLAELGITLPEAAAPVANYRPVIQTGNLLIVSGQLPLVDGELLYTGKLGADVSQQQGSEAARACLINVVAQVKAALKGDLSRVRRVVRLGGFMACTPDFTNHAVVMNGASDLSVAIFGESGAHARSTVGVPSLPLDAPVEIEAIIEVA